MVEFQGLESVDGVLTRVPTKKAMKLLMMIEVDLDADERPILLAETFSFQPRYHWIMLTDARVILMNGGTVIQRQIQVESTLFESSGGENGVLRLTENDGETIEIPMRGGDHHAIVDCVEHEGLTAIVGNQAGDLDTGSLEPDEAPDWPDAVDMERQPPVAGDVEFQASDGSRGMAQEFADLDGLMDASAAPPTRSDGFWLWEQSTLAAPPVNESIQRKLRAKYPGLRPDFLDAAARGVNTLANVGSRLEELSTRLGDDERVAAVVICGFESVGINKHGALAVTDQHVTFVGYEPMATRDAAVAHSIPLVSISSIDRSDRLIGTRLTVTSNAGTMRLTNILKVQATWVIDAIRAGQEAAAAATPQPAEPPRTRDQDGALEGPTTNAARFEELRELAALNDEGIISDEEFSAMKARILDL